MPGLLFLWQQTVMICLNSHQLLSLHKRWTLFLLLLMSLEILTSTSTNSNTFSTCPTLSGLGQMVKAVPPNTSGMQEVAAYLSTQLGSAVLLKNSQASTNEWPLGLVTQTFPSKDSSIRRVQAKVSEPGGTTLFGPHLSNEPTAENWVYGRFHVKLGIYQFGYEWRLRSYLTSSLISCMQVFKSVLICGAA